MVLATITPLQEEKFFASGSNISMEYCYLIESTYLIIFENLTNRDLAEKTDMRTKAKG